MNNNIIKYWIPVVLWMGFTFLMSTGTFSYEHTSRIIEPILKFLFPSISHHAINLVHAIIRKSAHLTEYCVLALLLFRAFRGGSVEPHAIRWALSSLVVVAFFAASDEFHQSFVASRSPSIRDVGVDTVGGLLALTVALARYHHSKRNNSKTDAGQSTSKRAPR